MTTHATGDRRKFCVTCQKMYANGSDHQRKNPSHVLNKPTESLEDTPQVDTEEVLSAATDEQAGKTPPKKVSGADFMSQPLFVASAGAGLGWVTARAFGADNALKKDEAAGIAAGVLRIVGRHLLKEVDMGALAEANGDLNDFLLIVRGVGSYIGRKLQESGAANGAVADQAQAAPRQQPQMRQEQATARQNGHGSMEEEAVLMQQRWAAGIYSIPDLGSEAA